mmetsp:Transcript_36986/g.94493  ORF Transcript_36986/g.94493 Transcript_36986/m.94493 type:complete len:236 (-) Transcript_36986:18-725(-)
MAHDPAGPGEAGAPDSTEKALPRAPGVTVPSIERRTGCSCSSGGSFEGPTPTDDQLCCHGTLSAPSMCDARNSLPSLTSNRSTLTLGQRRAWSTSEDASRRTCGCGACNGPSLRWASLSPHGCRPPEQHESQPISPPEPNTPSLTSHSTPSGRGTSPGHTVGAGASSAEDGDPSLTMLAAPFSGGPLKIPAEAVLRPPSGRGGRGSVPRLCLTNTPATKNTPQVSTPHARGRSSV